MRAAGSWLTLDIAPSCCATTTTQPTSTVTSYVRYTFREYCSARWERVYYDKPIKCFHEILARTALPASPFTTVYHLSISSIAQWRYTMSGLLDDTLLAEPPCHMPQWHMISAMRTYDLKLHVSYPQLGVDITILCTICITTATVIPYSHLPSLSHLLIVPVTAMIKEIRASMFLNSYRGTEQEKMRIILALAGWQVAILRS